MNKGIALRIIVADKAGDTAASALPGWTTKSGETGASVREFVARCQASAAESLVVEVSIAGPDGLGLLNDLVARGVDVPVVVVNQEGASLGPIRAAALRHGEQPFEKPELLAAMQANMTRSAASADAERHYENLRRRLASLSPRERQVLDLIIAGRSNKGVALALGISCKTVETHRAKIMRKMKVHSVAELVRDAVIAARSVKAD